MKYVERIKDQLTCIDVCNLLGIKLNRNSRCKSFREESDNDTSLLVSEKNWHDFGSGDGGDCIKLYSCFKGVSNRGAIIELAQHLNLNKSNQIDLIPEYSNRYKEIREETNRCIDEISKNWPDEAKAFVKSKGITGETAKKFKLGFLGKNSTTLFTKENQTATKESGLNTLHNRLIIPFLDKQENITYATGRSLEENPKIKYRKLPTSEFFKNTLWGINTLERDTKTIYIVEGMFDALALAQEGLAVISSTQTAFSRKQYDELATIQQDRQVIVCFDNDDHKKQAGLTGMLKLGEHFILNFKKDILMHVIEEEKADISDLYMRDGDLNFLNSTVSYLQYMIANVPEDDDKTISRIAQSFPESDQLKYKKYFIARGCDKKEIELKFKEQNKPPSEVQISEQIQEKINLSYIEDDAWYRYKEDEGYWETMKQGMVEHIVGTEYAKHRTSSRIRATTHLLSSDINKGNLQMNQHKSLFNVKNGMVHLDTKEIIPHSPQFYSSFQSDFSFNITGNYDFAERFFNQISMNNEQDNQYYRDILGELLIPDNRFHLAHFHIGEGRNGKSALLEVMKYIVGDKNTTQIPMHGLNKDFLVIMLKDSMLNIATENESHQKECELTFKQIVAGEEIAACRKNKDYINFKTRSKFHFAMNDLPKIYDKSDGVVDRMRICKYNAKFVNDPTEKHHLKKILNYHYVLQEHIQEFMNIAIDSRNRLLKTEEISYPSQHDNAMSKIREISNPILIFLKNKQFNPGAAYEIQTLYTDYLTFCDEEHHRAISKSNFQSNLEKSLKIKYMTNKQKQFSIIKQEAS